MKKHLLIEKAYEYKKPKNNPNMIGCKFDHLNGYWVFENSNEPIIHSSNFISPRTKKADRETGEDQKGE